MRKHRNAGVLLALLVLGVMTLFAGNVDAATLSWSPPATYTDGTSVSAADQANAVYTPASGPSATGPWTDENATPPGVTSATVPEPAIGGTLWYTVKVTINGQTSVYAPPVSKTVPYPTPNCPENLVVQ